MKVAIGECCSHMLLVEYLPFSSCISSSLQGLIQFLFSFTIILSGGNLETESSILKLIAESVLPHAGKEHIISLKDYFKLSNS